VAAKALTTRDHVRDISGLSALSNSSDDTEAAQACRGCVQDARI
jgi:hypothetical protein